MLTNCLKLWVLITSYVCLWREWLRRNLYFINEGMVGLVQKFGESLAKNHVKILGQPCIAGFFLG